MLDEIYNLTLSKVELLDLEKAMSKMIEEEGDTVYYSVYEKIFRMVEE